MSDGKAPLKSPVTQNALLHTCYGMFVLTTTFLLARVAIHVAKRKAIELQDYLIYFAYVLYVSLWTCYVISAPTLFKLNAVQLGEIPPYATILDDAGRVSRLIWAAQMCFYTCLFTVKFSLLALYRKLLVGLPGLYNNLWWAIVIFCIPAWIGCIVTSVCSCKSMKLFWKEGKCDSPEELKIQIISLYYSYGIDVITDLMVMALPMRLTWNLQMPRAQKIGIFVLFGSGFVCILFATLRVIQIGVVGGKAISPDPKWLSLWTVVETSMAVIIGCSPSFASLIRTRINSQKPSYDSRGYIKQPRTPTGPRGRNLFSLRSIISLSGRPKGVENERFWDEGENEQELSKIKVTTTISQGTGGSSSKSVPRASDDARPPLRKNIPTVRRERFI